jgi:hypothetical protein
MKAIRRPPKMQFFRDGDKVAEMAKFDVLIQGKVRAARGRLRKNSVLNVAK